MCENNIYLRERVGGRRGNGVGREDTSSTPRDDAVFINFKSWGGGRIFRMILVSLGI